MEDEILKINILSIAISGLLMLFAGMALYYFRNAITGGSIRFFLPIPPIGVAAYIYVFNLFKYYNGNLPGKSVAVFSEVLLATAISCIIFFTFAALLIYIISIILK